jgi:F-type H+-transporting ATPase subunit a
LLAVLAAPGLWAAEDEARPRAAAPDAEAKKAAEKKAPNIGQKTIEHVLDDPHGEFHLFESFGPSHFQLPKIFGVQITKFMVLELIAALLVAIIYVPLAQRLRDGRPPRGAWDNGFESLLTFVRDWIAKPSLGPAVADKYVPFLWTLFLFVLFNNLLGMVPFAGSATASLFVTGALALIVFFAIHSSAIVEMGSQPAGHGQHGHDDAHGDGDGHGHAEAAHGAVAAAAFPVVFVRGLVRYAQSMWPHIDLPGPLGWVIKPLVFFLEVQGVLVRNAVLAVRLFANMFAGHMVLATVLFFIQLAANVGLGLWTAISVTSVLGILALSLLELFVAFLQAYIFTFLTALFMGMAMHPQH